MAVGGGAWGIVQSVVLLISLRYDGLPFQLLLIVLYVAVISVAFWRGIKPFWRGTWWIAAGGLLVYFAYMSRFSIGVYLLPAAGLILFAGVLTIAGSSPRAKGEEPDKASPPQPPTAMQEQRYQGDPRQWGLTPREFEVLLLIAEGKSNQEIADALVISPNTVRHHVHQLLGKLNCSSRGEAAVIARIASLHSPAATHIGRSSPMD